MYVARYRGTALPPALRDSVGPIGFLVPDLDAAPRCFDENQRVYVKRPEQGKMKDAAFVQGPDRYWTEIVEPGRLKNLGR